MNNSTACSKHCQFKHLFRKAIKIPYAIEQSENLFLKRKMHYHIFLVCSIRFFYYVNFSSTANFFINFFSLENNVFFFEILFSCSWYHTYLCVELVGVDIDEIFGDCRCSILLILELLTVIMRYGLMLTSLANKVKKSHLSPFYVPITIHNWLCETSQLLQNITRKETKYLDGNA
jgi:hypothetical protein